MRGGEAPAGEAGSPRSPELYDFSDDSDYAAAAATNHTKAMRSDSADGGSDETARVDVIYEKERVTIHPTQYGAGISGKLRLFLQQGSLFLNFGSNKWKSNIKLYRLGSDDNPNVFLVNDFQDPLQLPGVATVANAMSRQNSLSFTGSVDDGVHGNDAKHGAPASMSQYGSMQKHKSNDPGRDLSIQVLEKFSLVTKFARDTTSSLFRDNSGANAYGRQQQEYYSNIKVSDKNKYQQTTPEKAAAPSDPLEPDHLPLVWGKKRERPLSVEEWSAFLDPEGRVVDSKALKKKSISATQAKRFTKFRERKGLIDKDVVRTDRSIPFYEGDDNRNVVVLRDILLTYSFYNFDLGYCQVPILTVTRMACMPNYLHYPRLIYGSAVLVYANSFSYVPQLVELLDPPLHNYFRQNDCLNYFFCFRWVLIQFKREFSFDQIMVLWEVLWTHYLSEHFHLYLCVAILKRYRQRIIGEQMDFDTLLKFINELSGQINLDRAIQDAEALCTIAGENGAACIPAGTPPSMPIETDGGLYVQEDEVL
ncbi:hypothetical protein PR202_ga02478 [Eleusine coracana subsp. coracana]|uniref:Rab-GAP TBC domain-containing protein n=1 Tax=Eleusine coracana subsp. coracana TaxID=191504 RepID=A0AAV5BLT8_ELECO|nr:hypothetical protein PR202_ga02478 [Eleusine coracana subsp. coracana]